MLGYAKPNNEKERPTEDIADKMSAIEQQIVNSVAYKSQGIKQPHQNKWQIYITSRE